MFSPVRQSLFSIFSILRRFFAPWRTQSAIYLKGIVYIQSPFHGEVVSFLCSSYCILRLSGMQVKNLYPVLLSP